MNYSQNPLSPQCVAGADSPEWTRSDGCVAGQPGKLCGVASAAPVILSTYANITVAVDDETYTRARVAAALCDTSVSALAKAFLEKLAAQETETERLKREERELRSKIVAFDASTRLSREDLHHRHR